MNVIPIDYQSLANQVRDEVKPQLDTIEDTTLKTTISTLLEGFLDLRSHQFWNNQDFSLILKEFPIEVFQAFSTAMKRLSISTGYALTHLMRIVAKSESNLEISSSDLSEIANTVPRISVNHFKILQVSAHDLEDIEEKVVFNHIGTLIFDNDVTYDLFRNKVAAINHCRYVEVPTQITKLLILAKTSFLDELCIREN